VHLQADAVPEAVLEVLRVPGVADEVPRRGVHIHHVHAGPGGLDPGPLRGRDELVDLALPAGGLAERDRAGHVRVIAAVQRAEVHRDQVTAAHRPVGRGVMRNGAVRPAGHDGVEGRALRAQVGHPPIQRRGQLTFGHARPDTGEDVGDGLIADPARGGQQLELGRILDRPQLLDLSPERDGGDTLRRSRELGVAFHGHLVRFEGHGAQAATGHLGGQPRLDEPLGDQLKVGAVTLRGQRVPRVGGQYPGAAGGQQQRGVGAGQAGQIANVRARGNQGRVHARLGDLLLRARPARRVNLWHIRNFTRVAALEAVRVRGSGPAR
jgi:hypothetical protein